MLDPGHLTGVLDVIGDLGESSPRRRVRGAPPLELGDGGGFRCSPACSRRRRRPSSSPRRAARRRSAALRSAHSWETKSGTNVIMTTPPLAGSAASTSSGTSRTWSVSARHDECEKITGARETSSASRMVVGGDVRDVDQHADPVHLPDHLPAEVGEPADARARRWPRRPRATFWLWVSVM